MNDNIDLKNLVLRGLSVSPQSTAGTVNGTGVDLRTGGAEVVAIVSIGAVAAGGTGTITLESSLNNNTADASAAADAYAQVGGGSESSSTATWTVADADTNIVLRCNLRNEKFVRVKIVAATAASLVSATVESPKHIVGSVQTASA